MILCNVNWHLNNFRLFNDDTNYAQGWKEVPNPNHQQDKNFQRIWKLPVDPVSLDDLSTWWRTFAAEKCEESVTLETKQLAFKFDDSWRIWIENGGSWKCHETASTNGKRAGMALDCSFSKLKHEFLLSESLINL